MLGDWVSNPVDSQSLTIHRLLVAVWSALAIYFPPLCLFLTCYEIIAVLLNNPVLMSSREIQWIIALFRPLTRWFNVEQNEIDPMEVKRIIDEVIQERKMDSQGDRMAPVGHPTEIVC